MEKFDFRLINKNSILVGNIRKVEKINEKMLRELRCCEDMHGDYSCACITTLEKENAIILRLTNECLLI